VKVDRNVRFEDVEVLCDRVMYEERLKCRPNVKEVDVRK